MPKANFCAECGERLSRKSWRARLRSRLCENCARRLGSLAAFRGLAGLLLTAAAAYGFGRYLRPAPPPLIIQRVANSPLPDGPVDLNAANPTTPRPAEVSPRETAEDQVYICGARTKKGTPCRRRVHFAGERCFQHKGMTAMVPLEKLVIKPEAQSK
jgi:hypothetical protein